MTTGGEQRRQGRGGQHGVDRRSAGQPADLAVGQGCGDDFDMDGGLLQAVVGQRPRHHPSEALVGVDRRASLEEPPGGRYPTLGKDVVAGDASPHRCHELHTGHVG